MGLTWTHSFSSSDDGSILYGADLQNIQGNIDSQVVTLAGADTISGNKTFTGRLITKDPWVDVRAYGATGDGVTDDSTAIQSALTAAQAAAGTGIVYFPAGTYLCATSLTTTVHKIIGAGRDKTTIKYSGTGSVGLTITGTTSVQDITVQTTTDAAIGIAIGDGARKVNLSNVYVTGNVAATNTGKGLLIYSNAAWIGGINLDNVEIQGYKYGIYCQSNNVSLSITQLVGTDVWLVGRSSGIITGSYGIYADALSTLNGSRIIGGLIEVFDVGIKTETGCIGLDFYGAIEGNNTVWELGDSFNGIIRYTNGSLYLDQGSYSDGSLKWFQNYHAAGQLIQETYYNQKHVTTLGGAQREFSWYVGNSLIDGGSPFLAGGFFSYGAESAPEYNYLSVGSHKMTWSSAAPDGGTWAVGDICWNTGVAAGGSPGWVCTTAGTPGTWKTMANVAA